MSRISVTIVKYWNRMHFFSTYETHPVIVILRDVLIYILYYIILYYNYIILYYIILYCIVLYYIILYYTILYYIIYAYVCNSVRKWSNGDTIGTSRYVTFSLGCRHGDQVTSTITASRTVSLAKKEAPVATSWCPAVDLWSPRSIDIYIYLL